MPRLRADGEPPAGGFDARNAKPSTHGLAGMRHRVEAAGGRLTVSSQPGQGTRIQATLPKAASSATAPVAEIV